MSAIVEKSVCGRTVRIVDPTTYPYGQNAFDDNETLLVQEWSKIQPGEHVIDVGASWGVYTLAALAMGAEVVAFEPSDDAVLILSRNVVENVGFADRFALSDIALSDAAGPSQALSDEVFTKHYPSKVQPPRESLDSWLFRMGRDTWAPTRIKVDVEGAEWHVVNGAVETLKKHRPHVYIEDHENMGGDTEVSRYPRSIDSGRRITEFLSGLGYNVRRIPWVCGRDFIVAEHPEGPR